MAARAMRFGMVGAGAIAQSYVQVFRALPEAEIVAVADVRADAARATAESVGCPAFASYESLAKNTDLDAVLICTPPATHAEICRWFLEAGTPVVCEKPLSTDAVSARALTDLAQRVGVPFTMATKFRFVEDVIRAKGILASGVLGEPIMLENAFTSRVDMSGRWNTDPALSGGGVIIDNGTHSVDVMRYFLGPIEEVFAVEGCRLQCDAVEDTARIFTRTANGTLGSIDLSWSINKELSSYVDLYGSHGVIRIGWGESKYRKLSASNWETFGKGYDKIEAMGGVIRNFVRAVRGEERILVTGDDAVASVEVIAAVYRSLETHMWTPVANGTGAPRRAATQPTATA